MTTYDNLNIAETTLIFQMDGEGNADPSISSGIFNLSSLAFLPNVPLIDQIEVERIFDTGSDTKFSENVFTIADRRRMFIFPKNWYSINEQTKVLTFVNLSTIPIGTDLATPVYYPLSRGYLLTIQPEGSSTEFITIPVVQAIDTTAENGDVRKADIVYIRRKTPSINSIVTFAPGTRLTTTQLNLQFDQLKYNIQELTSRIKNEVILKYDENAIDGPFLGNSTLKMDNNSIVELGSLSITTNGSQIPEANSNFEFAADNFAASMNTVYEAVTSGTVFRSGLVGGVGSLSFTGDFTASNAKIINVANGSAASDAATFGQVGNASNLITGTLPIARITDGTLPLEKLSSTWVSYTLPSAALPTILSNNSWGSSTASNTNNMVFITTDTKGRISAITQRNLATADLPTISGVAGTYGDSTTVLTQVTVDSTGRITTASERALTAADIPAVNASVVSGTLAASNLPLVSAGGGGATTVTSIPNSITVDTLGRVTAVSGGSITASNVSDFNTAVQTSKLNQMAAPIAAVSLNNQKILLLSDPTSSTDAANKNYIDTNFTSNTNLNAAIDSRLNTNSVFLTGGVLSAGTKKISNVVDPASDQDVVTRKYFTDNSIALVSGNFSVGSKPIIGLTMRAAGTLAETDAVNFGFVQSLILTPGTTLIGSTTPQIYRDAWSALSKTSGHLTGFDRYQRTFTDLGAVNSNLLLLGADAVTKTFVPYLVDAVGGGSPTVHDGYFWLDVGGANKVLNVYVTTGGTPSGNILTRNFGLSRLVAGAAATTSAQGIVSILAGNEGGINVTTGELSLKQATASQIGGIKQGTGLSISSGVASVVFPIANNTTLGQVFVPAVATSGLTLDTGTGALSLPTASTTQLGGVKIDTTAGLTNTSGLISVTRSDSTSSNSTTTLANSKAVNDLKGLSMLLDGTQTMTGKLTTATPSTNAGLNLPSGTTGSPAIGDVWNQSGTLKMRTDGSTTKDIAFTDSTMTGTAATATALATGRTVTLTGAVTGVSGTFNGTANLSFATTLTSTAAVISIAGTASQIIASGSTGAVTLSLPQNIATNSAVTFGSATLGNINISSTANTIATSATNNLILAPATAATAVTGSLAVSTALTVATTSGLTGAVTLGSSLALSTAASKIGFGHADATLATTSINRAPGILGSATTGDLVLRVPTDGKAYLVSNTTVATNPAANDALVTKGVMDTAISAATAAGLTTAGGIAASGSQTFGATSGSFIVSNGGAAKLTITNGGPATFANALTVTAGGLAISAGGLTVSGTTAITGALSATLNVTAATAPSTSSHLTNKAYVDGAINSISDTDANLVLKKLLMQIPIRQFTVAPLVDAKIIVHTTEITNMVVNVPKYFTGWHRATGTRSLSIVVPENYQIIILHFSSTTTDFTNSFNSFLNTVSNLHTLPVNPVSQMLAFRTGDTALSSSGTFTRTAVGTTFTGGPGGSTFTIFSDVGSTGHRSDLILMRIA